MVNKARMRSWFATTEFFVVIAIFGLVAGLLVNGQSTDSRTSESTIEQQPTEQLPGIGTSTGDGSQRELLSEFDRSAVEASDVVADPFTPTLLAVDLTDVATPADGSNSQETSTVPEPTMLGLLGSLAALLLLVNRMRSRCG